MNRMPWYLLVFLCFMVVSPRLRATAAELKSQTPPNIVFLLTDDQRWDTLGCMGNSIIQTPNVDALAERGIVFDRCFVTTSICATNRACILSGQYASKHGIWDFRTTFGPQELDETYPGVLKAHGYINGFIGKWGVGAPPRGYFEYDKTFPGQGKYENTIEGRTVHLNRIMGDQAVEFLETVPGSQPFCLSVSFKSPHVQDGDPRQFIPEADLSDLYRDVVIPAAPLSDPAFFDALPEFLQQTENRIRWKLRFATPEAYQESVKNYYRLITGADRVVGRIVDTLRQRGLADNTVIIFTGDNGFYLGERGFAGKWFPHEVSIQVPLVVFDPRLPKEQQGTRRQEMVLSIDIAPTILDLAGAPIPAGMQGRSLVPLLQGEPTSWRHEFFYEHLFDHATIPRSEGVRTERYKYIRYVDIDPPYEELYDLATDPDEAHNLVGVPASAPLLDRMRAKWESWREALRH